jgi:hypothetical protein
VRAGIGADGSAVLPFWRRRRVLTPVAGGVTAAFTADGDGTGWPYVDVPD